MIDGHYVYVHCRPDGTPFYVGKGQGKRAYKFGQRRQWHAHVVAKYGAENIIVAIYPQLSESQAFAFEISLLAGFHRAGFALVNLTSGGEGATGRKHRAESIEKMRQVQKGKIISPEARRKMAQAKLGRPWSEAMRGEDGWKEAFSGGSSKGCCENERFEANTRADCKDGRRAQTCRWVEAFGRIKS